MSGLEIERLTKRFGAFTAVDKVGLSVAKGSFVCLLGPSGCGKTTLLRMVAGLEEPSEGHIRLEGSKGSSCRMPTASVPGAIGIGRAVAYGGYKNRPMYDPEVENQMHASFEEYRNSNSATINHFYEKLLVLKERMNTPAAKRIAEGRHEIMLRYLDQFLAEWEGRDINSW